MDAAPFVRDVFACLDESKMHPSLLATYRRASDAVNGQWSDAAKAELLVMIYRYAAPEYVICAYSNTLLCGRDDLKLLANAATAAVVRSECTLHALFAVSPRARLSGLSAAERRSLGVNPFSIYSAVQSRIPLLVHGIRHVSELSWEWILGTHTAANITNAVEWVFTALTQKHLFPLMTAPTIAGVDLKVLSLAVVQSCATKPAPSAATIRTLLAKAHKQAIGRIGIAERQPQLHAAAAAAAAGMHLFHQPIC